MTELLLGACLALAFANGANDNFKGVATLYGSRALSYRGALALATVSTLLGSLLSAGLASGLVRAFSGRGLIPDALLEPSLLTAVALAAAGTVLLATRLGLPVSTTHALLGGLAGAGLVVAGTSLDGGALTAKFALPLLLGPLLSVGLAYALYRAGGWRVDRLASDPVPARGAAPAFRVARRREAGYLAGPTPIQAINAGHLISAGAVGFARGLNDTPKILGLIVGASALSPMASTVLVSGAMALGGMLAARRVARTLSLEITPLAPGRGLLANAVTSSLVIAASRFGLPVSTTHVATGGIAGIGGARRELRWRAAGEILTAWVTTLPLAAALGAALVWALG